MFVGGGINRTLANFVYICLTNKAIDIYFLVIIHNNGDFELLIKEKKVDTFGIEKHTDNIVL